MLVLRPLKCQGPTCSCYPSSSPPLTIASLYPFILQPTSWSLSTLWTSAPMPHLQFAICLHLCTTVSLWFLAYDLVMIGFTLQQIRSPSPPILSSIAVLSLCFCSPLKHLLTWPSMGHLCAQLVLAAYSRIFKLVSWHFPWKSFVHLSVKICVWIT